MRLKVSALLLLVGCSGAPVANDTTTSGGGSDSPDGNDALFIRGEGDRPACTAATKGKIVYISETKTLQGCDGAAWSTLDLGGRIVASIFCQGSIPNSSLRVHYSAAVTSSGDVYASGAISTPGEQFSETKLYSAQQNGALTASIIINYDAITPLNGGFWVLSLNRDTLVHTAEYNDVDATGGKSTFVMTPDKCIKNVY